MGLSRVLAGCAALVATAAVVFNAAAPTLAATQAAARPSTGRAHATVAPARLQPLDEIPDPAANVVPSSAFWAACYPTADSSCDAAALSDFDQARAGEGLGPMTLPTDFDSLSVAQQLFVLADIERVDRGLIPVSAMSAPINALALTGAEDDTDPDFPNPFYGNYGGSNWAGAGTSSLFPEFLWVYDDGVGSGNEDCTQAGDPGCWGHRHNILEEANYEAPLLMGAAEVSDPTYGGSSAEEFISGDHKDSALSPTWSTIQKLFPVGLSTTSITLATATAQSVPVTAWASGVDMNVTAAVTAGAGAWSVSPTSCPLSAGSECTLNVQWDPQAGSATSGIVTVTGPNGARYITLAAPGSVRSAALSASATKRIVVGGASTVVTGSLTDLVTDVPLAGHEIAVERRRAGQSSWTIYRTVDTSPSGAVGVTVRPVVNTSYRLVAAAGDDYAAVTSDSVRVKVRPLLTVSGHHRVAAKSADHLTVTSAPEQRGRVTLQRRRHGHWVVTTHGKLGPTGERRFTIHPARVGIARYRVVLAATDRHLGATSDPLVVTVH
jgi:hypothetical protein